MEEAFFDSPLYREFVGLADNVRLPDESTILRFRRFCRNSGDWPKGVASLTW